MSESIGGRTAKHVSFAQRMADALHAANYDAELLVRLEDFGRLIVDEVTVRINTIESKAVSITGWAIALIGFLLFQKPTTGMGKGAVAIAAVVALAAMWCSTEAAKGRKYEWPGQEAWFYDKYFNEPARLRAAHLLALLEAYQGADAIADVKGKRLLWAQRLLRYAGAAAAFAVWIGLS